MSRRDLVFGEANEKSVLPQANDFFNCEAVKTKGTYDEFDFIDEKKKIVFELKSRRVERTRYGSTMIGYNKVKKGLELIAEGWKVVLLFKFTDCVCYYKLTEDFDDKCVMDGGRVEDNGYTKVRPYAFININSLSILSKTITEEELLKKSKKYLINVMSKPYIQLCPELREKIAKLIAV